MENTTPVEPDRLNEYLSRGRMKPRGQLTRDMRVLLVDDDVESIVPMHLILAGLGCKITLAFNGRSAVSELIKKSYDLVVLDWLMPDLGGAEVLTKSQSIMDHDKSIIKNWKRSQLPFVTYSGCSFKEVEIPNCSNFNFVGHWQKPISLSKLSILSTEILEWLNKG